MDLPQPLQLSLYLINTHPLLSFGIATCVFGGALWLGGYKPVIRLTQKKQPSEQKAFEVMPKTVEVKNKLESEEAVLTTYNTSETLNRWVNAIQIKKNPADPYFVSTINQFFIGQLRFYDAHKDTNKNFSILRHIKSVQCRNTEEMVIEVMLRTSNRNIGRQIEKILEKIMQGHSVHVEWPSYPFSTLLQSSSHHTNGASLVGEYAGYLTGMAHVSSKTSLTELEIKLSSLFMEDGVLWAVWRFEEMPSDSEYALLQNAWNGFKGIQTEIGQFVTFKQKMLASPTEVDNALAVKEVMFHSFAKDGGIVNKKVSTIH